MPRPAHRHSTRTPALPALRALLGASFGWLLLLAFAHAFEPSASFSPHELRAGEERPAPVADIASAKPALRLLSTRPRSTPQHPLAALASASSIPIPCRQGLQAQTVAAISTERQSQRVIPCTWPLPRSSCGDDGEGPNA